MSLRVVDEGTSIGVTDATICLESDHDNMAMGFDELSSPDARTLALQEAAKRGLGQPRCVPDNLPPYMVDVDGKMLTPDGDNSSQPFRARSEIKLASMPL